MPAVRQDNLGLPRDAFYREYGTALDNGTAAVFAGAGLSRSAGYVDWKGLLQEFAEELGLNLDIETDLVAVAQYHINANNQVRSRLNQLLVNEFSAKATLTPSHDVLARLPIKTYWTTNYDQMIERAMEARGKTIDVKTTDPGFTTTKPDFEAMLYKMHGDIIDPEGMIITRDDYERYSRGHDIFLSALRSDLASKTFLFIGFSFSDPNVEYILGQLRGALGSSPRTHYTIMRREKPSDYRGRRSSVGYRYAANRQAHRIRDLQRYGIQTVLVDDYGEIPQLLEELERRYYRRNIVVAGAASDWAPLGQARLEALCHELGARVIADEYNLFSGFGVGISSPVIMGALEKLYESRDPVLDRRLQLRPFPQSPPKNMSREEFQSQYRRSMISGAGFVIFVAGNRQEPDGQIVVSPGVRQEFQIAREMGKYPIPIGATGWAARQVWEEVRAAFDKVFPAGTPRKAFEKLGDESASTGALVTAAFQLIHYLTPRAGAAAQQRR
jgi:hypothetical protein